MKDLGKDVQRLRIAADISEFLSSRDILSSTNFDLVNSKDINKTTFITESSVFIQLKSSS